jgi:hypothetical protein
VAVAVGVFVPAAPAAARTAYCSRTGDFCTSVARLKGVRYLRLSTFSFTGRVRICIKDPTAARVCRRFRLWHSGQLYVVKLIWRRQFPSRGAGAYRVSFFLGPTRLGPVLAFTQP